MNNTISPKGQCLCGEVQVTIKDVKPEVGVCHCRMCRQWSGGPFLSIDAGKKIEITGENSVAVYNSSEWAERAFCKNCGSNLYYRFKGSDAHHVLVGLFDLDSELTLDHQIFVDQKPSYYNFSEKTKMLTAAQVMEMFNADS